MALYNIASLARSFCKFILFATLLIGSPVPRQVYATGHHPPGTGHHPPGKGHRPQGKGHRTPTTKNATSVPLERSPLPLPTWREISVSKPPIDYCEDHVSLLKESEKPAIRIRFDATCGSRWRSDRAYARGAFESIIRTPMGDSGGLVTSFYLSFNEGSMQDEIDFEWLGNRKRGVQTNFYVKGVGGREAFHDLRFDTSEGYHNYTILYEDDLIEWYVDGRLLRREMKLPGSPFPDQDLKLYASVWNAQHVNSGGWAGFYSGRDAPYFATYKQTKIKTPM